MKIKTSDLIGKPLDWAVAKCEGFELTCSKSGIYFAGSDEICSYSTDWSQGGPIIEREKISVECKHDGWWVASYQYNYSDDKEYLSIAHTPLIAAMRCFCASRLGDEVDVPEELV